MLYVFCNWPWVTPHQCCDSSYQKSCGLFPKLHGMAQTSSMCFWVKFLNYWSPEQLFEAPSGTTYVIHICNPQFQGIGEIHPSPLPSHGGRESTGISQHCEELIIWIRAREAWLWHFSLSWVSQSVKERQQVGNQWGWTQKLYLVKDIKRGSKGKEVN